MYVAEAPELKHADDRSPCEHGLGIPANEWVTVGFPLRCTAGREVWLAATSTMWLDDIAPELMGYGLAARTEAPRQDSSTLHASQLPSAACEC